MSIRAGRINRRPLIACSALLAVVLLVALAPAPAPAQGTDPGPSATTVAPPTTAAPAAVTTLPPQVTVSPPTTAVEPEPRPDPPPPRRPDLAIRRAPGGPWQGLDSGRTGVVEAPARVGQTVRFVVRVAHRDGQGGTVSLRGDLSTPTTRVRWLLGRRDVTGAVGRGALRLHLAPGAHRDLVLGVTLTPRARPGVLVGRGLVARAVGSGIQDRVRALVTRPPVPVRLRDVGGLLGLPRLTHSFDFDIGHIDDDGIPDLVMSRHGRMDIYLNHRPGLESVFTATAGDIHNCAIGDADGDGRNDVYCTRGAERGDGAQRNSLFIQRDGLQFFNRSTAYGVDDPFGRGREATFLDIDHRLGADLFVGNENPRSDQNRSLNRTFLNTGAGSFTHARLLSRANGGALCAQAFDQDRNGWDDLLVCGGAGPATPGWDPGDNRLFLFRNVRRPDGPGRRLVDVAPRLGIDLSQVQGAQLTHLNGDRFADLVVVTRTTATIWPGLRNGWFGLPVFRDKLLAGHDVAIGDVDGRRGLDVYLVQGCNRTGRTNLPDRLLLDVGPGWRWQDAVLPARPRGCGDTAEVLDVDGDGADDVLVGNGRWLTRGPIQVLTTGRFRG